MPVAIVIQRRRCPELPTLRFADLMAPVLMACWAMGRLLGPQLMVNGGGHPTHQWFGMYYAGAHPDQKVLPVPIFQATEDFTIFVRPAARRAVAPQPGADRGLRRVADPGRPGTPAPAGIVLGVGMVLWGIERFLDEHLWLGEDGHLGSLLVQIAGMSLSIAGIVLLASRVGPYRQWRDSRPDPMPRAPCGDGTGRMRRPRPTVRALPSTSAAPPRAAQPTATEASLGAPAATVRGPTADGRHGGHPGRPRARRTTAPTRPPCRPPPSRRAAPTAQASAAAEAASDAPTARSAHGRHAANRWWKASRAAGVPSGGSGSRPAADQSEGDPDGQGRQRAGRTVRRARRPGRRRRW